MRVKVTEGCGCFRSRLRLGKRAFFLSHLCMLRSLSCKFIASLLPACRAAVVEHHWSLNVTSSGAPAAATIHADKRHWIVLLCTVTLSCDVFDGLIPSHSAVLRSLPSLRSFHSSLLIMVRRHNGYPVLPHGSSDLPCRSWRSLGKVPMQIQGPQPSSPYSAPMRQIRPWDSHAPLAIVRALPMHTLSCAPPSSLASPTDPLDPLIPNPGPTLLI